jgi:predicted transcriptional regulator
MARSKLTTDDAREWLESLQDVGHGFAANLALAVKMGVPTALGVDRRTFAQLIGHRAINQHDAVVDLFNEKLSQRAIADVMGMGQTTVQKILMEEGLIPYRELPPAGGPSLFGTPGRERYRTAPEESTSGTETAPDGSTDGEIEELLTALENKETEIRAEKAKAQEMRNQLQEAGHRIRELMRELEEAKNDDLSEADKERLAKEREAMRAQIEARFAPLHAARVVEELVGARESLSELIALGLNEALFDKINEAHTAFVRELTVAAAAVGREVSA